MDDERDEEDDRRAVELFEVSDYDMISSCVLNAYLSGAPLEQILETFLMCDTAEEFHAASDALVDITDIRSIFYAERG